MDIRSFFSPGGSKSSSGCKNSATKAKGPRSTPEKKKEEKTNKSKQKENNNNYDHSKKKSRKRSSKTSPSKDLEQDEVMILDSESETENYKNSHKKRTPVKPGNVNMVKEQKKKKEDVNKEETSSKRKRKNTTDEEKEQKSKKPQRKASVLVSSDEEFEEIKRPKKTSKSKNLKKGPIIFDSDSEEDPIPEPVKKKRGPKKKKEILASDSDEESRPSIASFFGKGTEKVPSSQKKTSLSSPIPAKKQVSAADFFGGGSVQRTERKTFAVKRKADIPDLDLEIHDDEDFEKTLQQIDAVEQKQKKARTEDASPSKPSTSLASKLSARVKNETVICETPEKKSPVKKETVKKTPVKIDAETKKKSPKTTPKKSPMKVTPKKTVSPVKNGTPKTSPATSEKSPASGEKPQLQRKGSGYRSYLMREGPRNLGSKEIPQGGENCLEGLTFVITGVLDSFERDEAKTLIEKYGGKVTGSLSKKTNYLLAGRDAGESKTAKATQFGTEILDEDGMLELIRTLPGKKSKYEIAAEQEVKSELKRRQSEEKIGTPKSKPGLLSKALSSVKVAATSSSMDKQSSEKTFIPKQLRPSEPSLLWVDKYKPQTLKQIIGQQGDKSNAKKLLNWLKGWHRNIASGKKPAFNRFSDDGAGYRAALLSGPPGVGKTTTATLVCQEMGFSFVELNASDTRSKKSLQQEVAECLNNHTLVDYFGEKSKSSNSQAEEGKQHCLVMDEVDGMAGNEDRGGMQELIGLIKSTKIPIICMCNDRNHQKIRSLSNHCFDLRFQRPRLEQIKGAMMSLACKEGLRIPAPAMNEIILAANQDIRQVIHNLSMWSANDRAPSYEQLKSDSNKARKDLKMGPFDVCRKVFAGGEETAGMTLIDKSDLFFHDYSFAPLFVHENYISVRPFGAKGDPKKHLDLLSEAADSICNGDLVDRRIRSSQSWNLLPLQAIYASVIPGDAMRGVMSGMISFPQWLGKNSTTGKTDRILQELRTHMRLNVSSDKKGLNMEYLPHLRSGLTRPLVKHQQEGVRDVIDLLDSYDLTREDFDNIMEVTQWPNRPDPMSQIESKVKAAFTRTYNKEVHLTPYAASTMSKKGRGKGGGGGTEEDMEGLDGEEGAAEEEEEEDMTVDAMIKAKKPGGRGKGSSSAASSASSKGKGTGKGRGRGRGKNK